MKMTLNPPAVSAMILLSVNNGRTTELVEILDFLIKGGKTTTLSLINKIISRPEVISRIVKSIISNEALWHKALKSSYRHENGFHKIVLIEGKYFKLRLHHFGATAKIPMENIHDHRWPFASAILSGELKMDIFQQSDKISATEEVEHFIYMSDKSADKYDTKHIGKSYLEKIESRIYFPGDTYLMRTDELHRITNQNGDDSITLILTGKPISKECNLYAHRPISDDEKSLVHYSSYELKNMLYEIIEKIYPQNN